MERPILFKGPLVRAILEGRKTQTRRVVKGAALEWLVEFDPSFVAEPDNGLCPLGQPGDRLWVRETFFAPSQFATPKGAWKRGGKALVRYCADDKAEWRDIDREQYQRALKPGKTPSIHMPRWACRLVLEITDVRVERLQAISEADACAEGCGSPITRDCKVPKFAALWASVYGQDSWDSNPWVWAITFRQAPQRIEE